MSQRLHRLYALLFAALGGCFPPAEVVVRTSFGTRYLCPAERIDVRALPGLRPHHLACMDWQPKAAAEGPPEDDNTRPGYRDPPANGEYFRYFGETEARRIMCGSPPPSIRNAPARLTWWQQIRQREAEVYNQIPGYPHLFYLEASGCGVRRLEACEPRDFGEKACSEDAKHDPEQAAASAPAAGGVPPEPLLSRLYGFGSSETNDFFGVGPGHAQKVVLQFALTHLCPPEEIQAREHPELIVHRVVCHSAVAEKFTDVCAQPPSEIAGDPGRVAIWQQGQDAVLRQVDHRYESNHIVELTGCGEHHAYLPAARNGGSRKYPSWVPDYRDLLDLGLDVLAPAPR
jgi:hypothetical protein